MQSLLEHPEVARALVALRQASEDIASHTVAIAEIPAPTFHEAERGAHVAGLMAAVGCRDVRTDGAGNVVGNLCGDERDGNVLVVCAHLDCAYLQGTPVATKREGGLLRGPGVGDNSAGIAVMLAAARSLGSLSTSPRRAVRVVATVGEEGLGGLRGIKRVCDDLGGALGEVVSVDGGLGSIVTKAIAVKRYRITVRGPGGHSWADYGRPSANHELARIGAALGRMEPPARPRTTLNIGIVSGGSSVNAISAEAHMDIDLRSEEEGPLRALEAEVLASLEGVDCGLDVATEVIDERPWGECPEACDLVRDAERALKAVDVFPREVAASTEANVPLSRGVPGIAFGPGLIGDAHSMVEHVDVESLGRGAAALLALLALRSRA